MRARLERREDDAMQEILRRAMLKDANEGRMLRDRLLSAASELGISEEAVLQAEQDYHAETARESQLDEYRIHRRRDFFMHLYVFITVNVFLAAINLLTYHEDKEMWALFPLLGWGIGLVIHAIAALGKSDWHDEEFQKWRKKREDSGGSDFDR